MYTNEDYYKMRHTAYNVQQLMKAADHLSNAVDSCDQSMIGMMNQSLVKAYNTLHDYIMYREQRMREEEA